jgi:multidrug efflux system outer membrane protein
MKCVPAFMALLTCGCMSMEPRYDRVAPPIPERWPAGDPYLLASEAGLPIYSYKDVFTDTRLQTLIAQAMADNRDLRIAAANIAVAREQFRIQSADQLPSVGISGGVALSGDKSGKLTAAYNVGPSIPSFELDLFGRLRSLSKAEFERYLATESAARAVRLALIADIANAWLSYAADSSLLLIAKETAASAAKSVQLTRLRYDGGVAPRTDLRQAEQIQSQAEADLARQHAAVAQDHNLLQLLVGSPVDSSLLSASIDEAFGTLVAPKPGLESSVLLRRPDVVQAEHELIAANADIGAARAAMFPQISLTSLFGFASTALTSLFNAGGFAFGASADISYTIFDRGAGRARVRSSEAQRSAALATYEKAIQTAFREVSDALARRGTINQEIAARQRQKEAASDLYLLTDARYNAGIDNFLASLDAQRSYYSTQQALIETKLTAAQNLVEIYRTVGGEDAFKAPDIK